MAKDKKLQEFKNAIHYLKRKERIRNNTDVAAAMAISPSYLSQVLNGNKPYPESFFESFESHFKINLNDPFTYTDLDWVAATPHLKAAPDNSRALFNSLKKLLKLKNEETEAQQEIIRAQQELIKTLQKEIEAIKPLIK